MKRLDPEMRSMLAAEYVLGTLQGPARRRFEALLADEGALQQEVDCWEAHLYALMARHLEPEEPPADLHERTMQRVAADANVDRIPIADIDPDAAQPIARGRSRRRPRRRFWAAAAVMAGVATIALLLPETVQHTDPPSIPNTEVAESEGSEPERATSELQPLMHIEVAQLDAQWTVGLRGDDPVVSAPDDGVLPPRGKDYELWWVDPKGTPHSLGVLPRAGEKRVTVPAAGAGLDSGALAVSREPAGGAPDGNPGEVLEAFPL